jgi:aflatoxin B1 aldehyde reductase
MYNALTRDVERELFPCLRRFGIRFYAFNPLAGGILTGKYSNHAEKPKAGRFKERPHYMNRFWKKSYFDAVETIKKACDAAKIDMAQASLAWMRHHSKLGLDFEQGNDAIIIGQSSLSHLEANLAGYSHDPLPSEVVKAFDAGWKQCKSDCPAYFQ